VLELEALLEANPLDCGDCHKCCQSHPGLLILEEFGDDVTLYEGNLTVEKRCGEQMLKTKPNGDCVYLDADKGCTAYDIRPKPCRVYDCRRDYIRWSAETRAERRRLIKTGQVTQNVQKEGRLRLKKIIDANNLKTAAD
jgi:Fe-S-cluster containining protein